MLRSQSHANLLIGTPEEAESYLRSFCHSLNIRLSNNPDFFVFRTETFGIDEARELKLLSSRKTITLGKIFLIAPERLTLEAQNALLKTFEDPIPNTRFFLSVREEGLVAPTLRSRMQVFRVPKSPISDSTDAETFLTSSLTNRLIFAKEFADEEKNLSVFLDLLLLLLRKKSEMCKFAEKVYAIRRLIGDSNMASRLILEHLSLVLK
ncbi:MAG: hypothetical protein HYX23_00325 [Candidatus Zambryskibacteria bacterium]|nr:hypothetical protein [Candidatus Zambryskibacteria bacterium]